MSVKSSVEHRALKDIIVTISWSGDTYISMLLAASKGVILHPDHMGTPKCLKEWMIRKTSK